MPETRALPLDEPIVTGNTKAAVKAAGGKSADLYTLPYDEIHFDPRDNVRPLDVAWARHLAKLIQTNGYDKSQPLHCYIRKVNGEDLVYLWKGQHRLHGIGIAIDNGFDPGLIPVVIANSKTVNRVNMIFGGLTSNDSKANSPLDLAEKITELREQHGIDDATICKRLEITQQTIRDVMLLASAPAEIHKLVRTGTVSGTVAIEQIRQHGPEKALERIAKAAEQVKSTGKGKVTKKHLDKAPAARTAGKITDLQAKQLLQALQAVLHDPVFGKLSPGTIAGVHAALTPHADLLDAVPKRAKYRISKPNANGVYTDHETIKAPISKRTGKHPAEIHLAQVAPGKWISSTSYMMGTGSGSSPCAWHEGEPSHPTRGQAIRAAVSHFTRRLEDPRLGETKEAPAVRAWLDKLWTAPDPDWTEEMAQPKPQERVEAAATGKAKSRGTPMNPAAAWPFPTGTQGAH